VPFLAFVVVAMMFLLGWLGTTSSMLAENC
jgi:hypothetical protein